MSQVVRLSEWRARRAAASSTSEQKGVERLDRAVHRLRGLLDGGVEPDSKLAARVETELLAIMGELTVGFLDRAAGRAERLADRLARAP